MTPYLRHEKAPIKNGMPVPVASSRHNLERVREAAAGLMRGLDIQANVRRAVFREIESYPDEMVERLQEVIAVRGHARWNLTNLIAGKPSKAKLNRALFVLPALDGVLPDDFRKIMNSLSYYPQLAEPSDDGSDSALTLEQCSALVRVVCWLTKSRSVGVFKDIRECNVVIKDEALVDLVLEFPERVEQMMATSRERDSLDAELLRVIIAGEVPALGSGLL